DDGISDYLVVTDVCQSIPLWRPCVEVLECPFVRRIPQQSGEKGIRPPQRQVPGAETEQQARGDFSSLKLQDKCSAVFAPEWLLVFGLLLFKSTDVTWNGPGGDG